MLERYLNDKNFHDLVMWLRRFVADGAFTIQDLKDAVELVNIKTDYNITNFGENK